VSYIISFFISIKNSFRHLIKHLMWHLNFFFTNQLNTPSCIFSSCRWHKKRWMPPPSLQHLARLLQPPTGVYPCFARARPAPGHPFPQQCGPERFRFPAKRADPTDLSRRAETTRNLPAVQRTTAPTAPMHVSCVNAPSMLTLRVPSAGGLQTSCCVTLLSPVRSLTANG
jgi:hypothetical protein